MSEIPDEIDGIRLNMKDLRSEIRLMIDASELYGFKTMAQKLAKISEEINSYSQKLRKYVQ